jgi:type IV pilus assembly protein PilB
LVSTTVFEIVSPNSSLGILAKQIMEYNALAKLLITANILGSDAEAEQIAKTAESSNQGFLSAVIKEKKVSALQVANFLSQKFQLVYADLDFFDLAFIPNDIDLKVIEKHKFLPLKKHNNGLTIAVSDPNTTGIFTDLKFQTGSKNINLLIVEDDKLTKYVEKYLQLKGNNFAKDLDMENVDLEIESGEPAPQTHEAASDVLLYERKKATISIKDKIASRIKVISNLDISEKRVPQDGRFKLKISEDRAIDFRVSTLPTIMG